MLVKTFGSTVCGVGAITVTIEVNVTAGLHTFLIGLPDSSVKESIQRVESAIKNSGYNMPRTKLVINLAPADIKKTGCSFDLPIALGILGATGQIPCPEILGDYMMAGELGLDGSIHPIRGILPIAEHAWNEQFKALIVPRQNGREAAVINGLAIHPLGHISEVISLFNTLGGPGGDSPGPASPDEETGPSRSSPPAARVLEGSQAYMSAVEAPDPDFRDVRGQESIKRALEIAAAG